MGALHEGHASLFQAARERPGTVIASVFVNPRQFNDPADLAAYPRTEHADATIAQRSGVDVLFVPDAREVYPEDVATSIVVEGAALGFEGAHRPGHFNGVALVCLKLFNLVQPDEAIFGQKDAQQVAVIRQIVSDLNLPLTVTAAPTVRDGSGLALSSRNARLTPADRNQALAIPRALRAGLAAWRAGQDPAAAARVVLSALDVDYADVATFSGEPTLVVAVTVGGTRLIDNVPLDRPDRAGL
jgi:pantoate--beta-alanine ligase